MTLIIFKVCLPILLGYILFAAITDRIFPFFRPADLKKRPRWFLGLWSGVTISVLGVIGLDIAYKSDVSALPELITPAVWITALALLPGIIGFVYYRSRVKRQISLQAVDQNIDVIEPSASAPEQNPASLSAEPTVGTDESFNAEDDVLIESIIDADDQYSRWAENLNNNLPTQDELDETQLFEVDLIPTGEPDFVDETNTQHATDAFTSPETNNATALDADETLVITNLDSDETIRLPNIDRKTEHELSELEANETLQLDMSAADDTLVSPKLDYDATLKLAEENTQLIEGSNSQPQQEINRLRVELANEMEFRKEIETHLRITRKALSQLETENRSVESEKSTALMKLERALEQKINHLMAAEARAEKESQRCLSLEGELLSLREDALKLSSINQENDEARDKALSAASDAQAIACNAMQARMQLENQLAETQSELDRSKETIRQLKLALEQEKLRSATGLEPGTGPLTAANG